MVLMGFEVGIRCSEGLDTFLAFEQCSLDGAILELQKTELDLAAYVNQVVRQGQRIGRLVVSPAMDGCLGPHVHWGVRLTSSGADGIAVCPRDYSDVVSQSRVDDLFKRLCDGNSSWLYPPCLPPPPPECHAP